MICFFNAKKENASYRGAIENAIRQVFDSGCYLLGEQLEAFEYEFSQYCNVEHTVGVGSPKCKHKKIAYKKSDQQPLPNAEDAAKKVFSLPIGTSLNSQKIGIIIGLINDFTLKNKTPE